MDVPLTLSSTDDWAAAACRPGTGSGTLARIGLVTLLVGSSDPETVAPVLGQAEMVAANGGQGRQLVRGYALLLGTSPSEPPPFVAFAPHSTGLAVLVHGDASVTVNGETWSGKDSLAWVERLVPWPITELAASVDSTTQAQPHLRLDAGIIAAGGLTLGTGVQAGPEPEAMEPEPEPEVMEAEPEAMEPEPAVMEPEPEPQPEPESEPVLAPPPPPASTPEPDPEPAAGHQHQHEPEHQHQQPEFDAVKLADLDDLEDDEMPAPLPIVVDERDVTRTGAHTEQVRGVFCKNRHFSDPRQLFCAICGINMVQQTPVLVSGTRPPLGVIVLDDGAVFQVDSGYLLGRDPDSDDRVRAGTARGVLIQDTSNQISRVHARLELRGWDVVLVDNASTNGTFINPPQTNGWQRLPSGGEHLLVQGTRVRIGHRTLAFNTHAGG